MRKLLCVLILLGPACAQEIGPTVAPDEDEDGVAEPPMAEPVPEDPDDKHEFSQVTNDPERDPSVDVCKLLPTDDSACAHACDPVALATFVPTGTCVTFTCTLTDGSLYRTGGCNSAE
jgi:hypothetical protein